MLTPAEVPLTDEEFELFRALIYAQTGICLRDTKRSLLTARLMKRMRHYQYQSFIHYYQHLQNDDPRGDELQQMINAVTTNKTSFFRESHHFDFLTEHVLVPARQRASQGTPSSLRLWSAGCSSGEEPYSIAMTILAALERVPAWDIKVLASDIDTNILDIARAGIYPLESVGDLPQRALKQYFLRGSGEHEGFVQVKPAVKNLVTFARLNLMEEPWPFRGRFDAIFCRNVIIYFDRDSQRRVLERFGRCLKPGGLFFAGHSENLFWLGECFEPIGRTAYRVRSERSGG
ncbi:MAG TPA: protein-glutamate O-methyltransferase CheR [Terriglobales bacterium]|nr:protein-glutamate O-methyltransferase CheR [Terriglobales bacterium]